MAKIVECSPPGGFPDAVTGLGNLRPGSNRMLLLDCGHSAIVQQDYPVGAGWPCSWFACPGNPETISQIHKLSDRELALWFPVWDGLLSVNEEAAHAEVLGYSRTADGMVSVTAGLVRALRA